MSEAVKTDPKFNNQSLFSTSCWSISYFVLQFSLHIRLFQPLINIFMSPLSPFALFYTSNSDIPLHPSTNIFILISYCLFSCLFLCRHSHTQIYDNPNTCTVCLSLCCCIYIVLLWFWSILLSFIYNYLAFHLFGNFPSRSHETHQKQNDECDMWATNTHTKTPAIIITWKSKYISRKLSLIQMSKCDLEYIHILLSDQMASLPLKDPVWSNISI